MQVQIISYVTYHTLVIKCIYSKLSSFAFKHFFLHIIDDTEQNCVQELQNCVQELQNCVQELQNCVQEIYKCAKLAQSMYVYICIKETQ